MLSHLLLLVALSTKIQADDGSTEIADVPTSFMTGSVHTSYVPILSGQPIALAMRGDNNYVAAQQIFYINTLRKDDPRTTEEIKVPVDYHIILGIGAHKLHTEKVSWNEARRACIAEGAHLAIINSKKEEEILLRLMNSEPKVEVQSWLGFHDLYQEGDFVTILDQPLKDTGFMEWTNAYPNEPDNLGGNQNCGSVFKIGGLDDAACSERFTFICEVSLD